MISQKHSQFFVGDLVHVSYEGELLKDIFHEECHGILSAWLNCMQKSEIGSICNNQMLA